MGKIDDCLSPSLHGMLYQFAYSYISRKPPSFEKFGAEFFEDVARLGRRPSRFVGQKTMATAQTLESDPTALYKLVECDPDLLYLRDKIRCLIMGFLINDPPDLAKFGAEYFNGSESLEESNNNLQSTQSRREGVFAEGYDPEQEDSESDLPHSNYEKTPEELKDLRRKIRYALLFRSLDDHQMAMVLAAMRKLKVEKDSFVICQGDDGDYFYVVDEGIFEAYVRDSSGVDQKVTTYNGSGSFGELALLYNMPRVATVKAITEGSLWCLDRANFRKIVVHSAFKKRKKYETLLANVPVLKQMNTYERQTLADALQPMKFEDGECIIRQSDEATGMYFVEEGTVIFSYLDGNGRTTKLSRITEGGYFGELAMVNDDVRAVSAFASGDVRLAFVDRDIFERLLGPCKELMKRNVDVYKKQRDSKM